MDPIPYITHFLDYGGKVVNIRFFVFSNAYLRMNVFKNKQLRISIEKELNYINFKPLKVVSRYRDPQLQVAENYSYLFILRSNIWKSWCLNTQLVADISDLNDK